MPIYDFRCRLCGLEREVRQSMHAASPVCPGCGNSMELWIRSAPAVHGADVRGRERAARSLPQCGKGCRCCP